MRNPVTRLGQIRRDRGIKQKDLAHALGLKQSTLSGVENGHHRPWPGLRQRAARLLGVSEEDLFPETVEKATNANFEEAGLE